MSTDNRSLVNLTRLSRDATLKLERILRFGATALRDKILDEELNRQAERYDTLSSQDTLTSEAAGALKAACEVAVALGVAYRNLAKFSLKDWYQACGLDENGELHDGLFDEDGRFEHHPSLSRKRRAVIM